ncbi:sulfatase-like hydrolase/transferase [Paraglaciecola sp. L3A3]|uniref:sulfatase-like hydrolase/transferase n=1 Tax=Paraglaciecola sp. L3A3 TaxID=2686358 RepID=UPI0018EF0C33|nr:sulfatase-like hydrolase/transferase [Paraglaciecola sp. L3A3]
MKVIKGIIATLLVVSGVHVFASEAKQPNIIFVFSDDQRFNSMSMTGDPVTQTPNLDQLAKEGVFFNQTFITSPICGPSRANIFTAQWERKNKIGFNYLSKNIISEGSFRKSWLMQLKNAGYSTAFIGKAHTKIGDRRDTILRDNIDFAYFRQGHIGFYLDDPKKPEFSNLHNKTQIEGFFEATKAYLTQSNEYDYFYKNAHSSIKNSIAKRDPKKPFAAWINFNLPHAASIGGMGSRESDPAHYRTLYTQNQMSLPEGYPVPETLPKEVFSAADLMKYYDVSNPNQLKNKKLSMSRAVFSIDKFMGDLRVYLTSIGEQDNTIIIFCSDNGLLLGEHGLGGKSILYDENVHVPMIVYSPFFDKQLTGKKINELVVGQDIPASILDFAGIKVPESYQGKSFTPLIKGDNAAWRQEVFLENLFTDQGYPRQEALRTKEYKYIRSFSKQNDRSKYLPGQTAETGELPIYEELYHLVKDPSEQHNLALDPKYQAVLKQFRVKTSQVLKQLL